MFVFNFHVCTLIDDSCSCMEQLAVMKRDELNKRYAGNLKRALRVLARRPVTGIVVQDLFRVGWLAGWYRGYRCSMLRLG